MKKLLLILLLGIVGVSIANTELKPDDFYIDGKPIRPSCIAIFNLGAHDDPFITAIDLNACQKSVITNKTTHEDAAGKPLFYLNDKNADAGTYSYHVLGKTTGGIYVLHTFESKREGEIRDMLLLLKLQSEKMPIFASSKRQHNKSALMANLIGFVKGGDRCSGGIKKVTLDHYNIEVNQYPYVNSVQQCKGAITYTIDTSQW